MSKAIHLTVTVLPNYQHTISRNRDLNKGIKAMPCHFFFM